MNQIGRQTVRWLGFGVSGSLTKTLAHFFPSSGNVTAPYPAQCKLTVFAETIGSKSVVLDGARFSQPDGVRLDVAFPSLEQEKVALCGIIVELVSSQPRIDISHSACVIEFSSKGHASKYRPLKIGSDPSSMTVPAILDSYTVTSLVVVNGTEKPLTPPIGFIDWAHGRGEQRVVSISSEDVPPLGVRDVELNEGVFANSSPLESSNGLVRIVPLVLRSSLPDGAACYVIHRDALTRRPVSIFPLESSVLQPSETAQGNQWAGGGGL